jgi:Protein of unknown function (DUF2721)
MNPFADNPFAVLTFIAAPAVLINASSVMALGTSNRFARAIDRARHLASLLENQTDAASPEAVVRGRQLGYTERRAQLLVRALTAFYLSVGAFAASSLASLLGAIFATARLDGPREVALWLALPAGVIGIGGLVTGAGLLVWETRMTLRVLREETRRLREKLHRRSGETAV